MTEEKNTTEKEGIKKVREEDFNIFKIQIPKHTICKASEI